MKTSPQGVAFIAAREGVVTRAYRDAAGVWTIGVGHTAAAGPPKPARDMTITRAEAFAILTRDLPKYERRVAAALPDADQPLFDGAVSFDFNTGAIFRASWVKAARDGNHALARQRLMLWTKAGGRTVAGLVRRRTAEARLIFDGDYGGAECAAASANGLMADLGALGFAGSDAVLRYQQAHPDLVADGIAGPATRASIARDIAARRRLAETAGVAVSTGALAGTAAAAGGGAHPVLFAIIVTALVVAVIGGAIAWRYRDELIRILKPKVRS